MTYLGLWLTQVLDLPRCMTYLGYDLPRFTTYLEVHDYRCYDLPRFMTYLEVHDLLRFMTYLVHDLPVRDLPRFMTMQGKVTSPPTLILKTSVWEEKNAFFSLALSSWLGQ